MKTENEENLKNPENQAGNGKEEAAKQKKNEPGQKRRRTIIFVALIFLAVLICLLAVLRKNEKVKELEYGIIKLVNLQNFPFLQERSFVFPGNPERNETAAPAETANVLEEAGSMKESSSADWWLNSGGLMLYGEHEFSTNLGALPENDKWRKLYAKTNPRDTDNGFYPQNIFRLVTRKQWQNFSQTLYFNINKINMSGSKFRDESNGVLLFNRYQDGDNLYYTGLRVDGDAVIKKKISGTYYTLAEKNYFMNKNGYDRDSNPNVIPLNTWIGIRSEVNNIGNNSVDIKFFVDMGQTGDWKLILETKDKNNKYGSAPFLKKGFAGIRTDFMDVKFQDFEIEKLN